MRGRLGRERHVPGFRAADRGGDPGRAVAGVPAPAAASSATATRSRSIATSWRRSTAIVERGLVSARTRRGPRAWRSSAGCSGWPARCEATVPAEPGPGRRGIVLAVALLVPTLAATFYAVLGSPDLPDRPLAMRQDLKQENPERPDVQQMVARLEARLAQSPGRPAGLADARAVARGAGRHVGLGRGVPPRAGPRCRRSGRRRWPRRGADRGCRRNGHARGQDAVRETGRGRAPRSPRRVLSGLGRVPSRRASGRAGPVA